MKIFNSIAANPSLPSVLLLAPTGFSAVNIDATAINSGLAMGKEMDINLPALSDHKNTLLRLSLTGLSLLIFDEISMVSNKKLLHIHQRLTEIFGTCSSYMFVSLFVIYINYH